jgi:hypothetical protein
MKPADPRRPSLDPARLDRMAAALPPPVKRSCGTCTLCCQLIGVAELGKKSFQDCVYRRGVLHAGGPGCGIYAGRPRSCAAWACMWLRGDPKDWPEAERPDRVGFVVDELADLIRINGEDTPAAQIWVSAGHDDDWGRDPAHAIIHALINKGLAVLWRLHPGTHGITFARVDGQLQRSPVTEFVRDERLGNEIERSRRVEEIGRQRRLKL